MMALVEIGIGHKGKALQAYDGKEVFPIGNLPCIESYQNTFLYVSKGEGDGSESKSCLPA